MKKNWLLCFLLAIALPALFSSCANIIPPVGGARDSLPPVLVKATPAMGVTNFKGKNITLLFDEYVEVQNSYENVLMSPSQEKIPIIDYRLHNVFIRIKDTLEPNTTYSIQFGNAIKDVNEGNVFKNFSYVFSTGSTIDSFSLEGSVQLAETGKVDSTLIVVLHRSLDDSAVAKDKPRYMTRLDGKGHFRFEYLPSGTFGLFALKDEGFKKYSDNRSLFAFTDAAVVIGPDNPPVDMLAFVAEKDDKKNGPPRVTAAAPTKEGKEDKRLKFQLSLDNGQQNLLKDLQFSFAKPLKSLDSSRILFTDTFYNPVKGYRLTLDTSKTKLSLSYPWPEKQFYRILLQKDFAVDSSGNTQLRNDTIKFQTRSEETYGIVSVRFTGLDFAKHPVLQWVQNDQVYSSYPLTAAEWSIKRFEPGSYEMRILYDTNNNGVWDTGDYWKKKQPEKVISIDQKFNVRANWENGFTVVL